MAFANSIQIGPEFFDKAKNDYQDWKAALIREFMQNSMDCGSKRIDIMTGFNDGVTYLLVENDGEPMGEDILVNKLLALGASGKDFAGTVGGFGKAKEILYFCHLSYQIHSGSLMVSGEGAGYDLSPSPEPFLDGTRSTIKMDGNHDRALCACLEKFASECLWSGELYLNGVRIETNLRRGRKRRDLDWAVVYTSKTLRHRLIVRIDGMPMFSRYVALDRCVVVEINRSSGEALTSNRDGLSYEYSQKLSAFVDQLNVDKASALRDHPVTTYHHFDGDKQGYSGGGIEALVTDAYATIPQSSRTDAAEETVTVAVDQQVSYDDGPSFTETATRVELGRCSHEFIAKNNTSLRVPAYFLPSGFSAYSSKLVSVWIKCLLELHQLLGHEDSFAVGFIIDDDRAAECEKTSEYGRVYYINPAVIVEQDMSRSRSLKKRWKFNNAGYYSILSIAVHEIVHGMGCGWHDEDYASKITEVMGLAMANKSRFHHCFR